MVQTGGSECPRAASACRAKRQVSMRDGVLRGGKSKVLAVAAGELHQPLRVAVQQQVEVALLVITQPA